MSLPSVRAFLTENAPDIEIIELPTGTATVALAALVEAEWIDVCQPTACQAARSVPPRPSGHLSAYRGAAGCRNTSAKPVRIANMPARLCAESALPRNR